MIWWITGNSGAGKTTLARTMASLNDTIVQLDGDMLRRVWDIGLTKEDRIEHNLRIARLANEIHAQGFHVVVSTICPYIELREQVQKITDCQFIYLAGGKEPSDEYPYER